MKAELFIEMACSLGETPIWMDATGELAWIDATACVLHIARLSQRAVRTLAIPGNGPAGMVINTSKPETLMISRRDGLAFINTETGEVTEFSHPARALPHLFYNDGKIDPAGRLWVGTAEISETDPRSILYRFEGARAEPADAGFAVCNGPAFSPDGNRLYLSDSVGRRVLEYRIDRDGRLLDRQVLIAFAQNDGLPDGITVDDSGALWVAHWGGACVSRFSPDGILMERVSVPVPNVTSITFGGTDRRQLFVTTALEGLDAEALRKAPLAGSIFVIRTDVPGPVSLPFDLS